jgi:hypothetical protein
MHLLVKHIQYHKYSSHICGDLFLGYNRAVRNSVVSSVNGTAGYGKIISQINNGHFNKH